jgi:hypothetical protein
MRSGKDDGLRYEQPMLLTMLFALAGSLLLGMTDGGEVHIVGPFVVSVSSKGTVVESGGKRVRLEMGLNCDPSYSKASNRLVLGLVERVACIAPGPRVCWVKSIYEFSDPDWAYVSDPTSVYAAKGAIYVTVGKVTAGPLAEINRLPKNQRKQELEKRLRIVALHYDGRMKWNKPQSIKTLHLQR